MSQTLRSAIMGRRCLLSALARDMSQNQSKSGLLTLAMASAAALVSPDAMASVSAKAQGESMAHYNTST